MVDVQFKRGEMQAFIAARSFALGNTGTNLSRGQEILFDGTNADVGGDILALPTLRGAIKAGWLIPAAHFNEDDDSAVIPVSANIQVRHPTNGGNPMDQRTASRSSMVTTESDEREVGNVSRHASQAKQANATYRRGQPVNVGGSEPQDGVPVRRLKTPSGERAKNARTVLTAGSVGDAFKATEVTIDPGKGMTEDEMLARMDEQSAQQYLAEKAARKAQYVDDAAPKVINKVAGKKGFTTREGISSVVTTGGGVETGDLQGLDTGKAKQATVEVEGMTFKTTNGPEVKDQPHPRQAEPPVKKQMVLVKEAPVDVRRMVAKQLCPDFPENYDFAASDKKKLARLQADFEDRFDVLKAVFAAEGDAFKALLIQEFPQAFAP